MGAAAFRMMREREAAKKMQPDESNKGDNVELEQESSTQKQETTVQVDEHGNADNVDIDNLKAADLRVLVEAKGGTYTNKPDAIKLLKGE